MGSPLGPILANIFVGYNENKLFAFSVKPQLCKRYMDDAFAIFKNEAECNKFFNILNSLNPALKFTCEKEESESLVFLDQRWKSGRVFRVGFGSGRVRAGFRA